MLPIPGNRVKGGVCIGEFLFRPLGEVLFFASPKKSTQKKGEPEGLPAI
jgi:hypothetical protein